MCQTRAECSPAFFRPRSPVDLTDKSKVPEFLFNEIIRLEEGFPLAGRPLPDHRTYGLVGRSLWQSPITYTAARLFRPVFLSQQNKTKCTGKVLGWQCSCQIAVCTDMPRSLAGRGQWSGQNIRESCFAQISQFGLGQFPLFPVLYAIGPRFCLRLPSHEPSLTRSLVAA